MNAAAQLSWRELHFQRPLAADRAIGVLRGIATDHQLGVLVFELRGHHGRARFFVGAQEAQLDRLGRLLDGLLPSARLTDTARRADAVDVVRIKATTRHRALRVDQPDRASRALLGAVAGAGRAEHVVVQVVIGPRRVPLAIPSNSPTSLTAPLWRQLWYGDSQEKDGEQRRALADKVKDHGVACEVRIGSMAVTTQRQRRLISAVVAALRTNESTGLKLAIGRGSRARLNSGRAPLLRWSLRLNVAELLQVLGWPVGDDDLPGLVALHPRRLPPSPLTTKRGRVLGRSGAPGHEHELLKLSAKNGARHALVLGPSGVGKSTLLGHLAVQTIADGDGCILLEPKRDLTDYILTQIPVHRWPDVCVLDPLADRVVGLNPLHRPGASSAATAESLMGIFRRLYGDALGPRSSDLLASTLATLTRYHPAPSLVMVPLMLTNAAFRQSVTSKVDDPIGLGPFWAGFESYSEAERRTVVMPLLNKVRPWLTSPRLRAVIGQQAPLFDIGSVMSGQKVLLIPLDEECLGSEAGRLLGSLVVAMIWAAVRARSVVPEHQRRPVTVIVDELSRYVGSETDLGDALVMARGYGCGFALAMQHLRLAPTDLQAGLLANCRSRILFNLSAADAGVMAKGHPEISPDDFTALGAFETYQSLNVDSQATPYAFARTLPPDPARANPARLRAISGQQFGRPLHEVEASLRALVVDQSPEGGVGRRRRQS